jgi:hypothetical protein
MAVLVTGTITKNSVSAETYFLQLEKNYLKNANIMLELQRHNMQKSKYAGDCDFGREDTFMSYLFFSF